MTSRHSDTSLRGSVEFHVVTVRIYFLTTNSMRGCFKLLKKILCFLYHECTVCLNGTYPLEEADWVNRKRNPLSENHTTEWMDFTAHRATSRKLPLLLTTGSDISLALTGSFFLEEQKSLVFCVSLS